MLLAKPGDFCPNEQCPMYQKLDSDPTHPNLIKAGRTKTGVQRYECKTCHTSFTETKGTLFYRKRTPAEKILETLALLAEGDRVSSLTRVKGIKEDTILSWMREAAEHTEQVNEVLLKDFRIQRGQLDGMWLFIQKKGPKKNETETVERPADDQTGEFMRSTMLDVDSRLRVATAVEQNETLASQRVFETLQARGHPEAPPPTISDGWGGIDQAMVAVYGQIPEYGGCGRPPTRKQPGDDWLYLQMVKQYDEHGHFAGSKLKAIHGELPQLIELLGKSTAYIERDNLTSRIFNARQHRKTLAFSKNLENHRAAAIWEDGYYNLIRYHKSLRLPVQDGSARKWKPRTPMMAAGLTQHAWTVKELLTTIPLKR